MAPTSVETPAAVPARTHEQRMRALRRANEIRSRRAQLKRDLKAGKAKVEALLLDPPDYVLSAKAFDMILAVPKYGRVKANRILTQCRISPSKTIGGLSERQRAGVGAQVRRLGLLPGPGGGASRRSPLLRAWGRVQGLRDHRALGRRKGDPDRCLAPARPGTGAHGL